MKKSKPDKKEKTEKEKRKASFRLIKSEKVGPGKPKRKNIFKPLDLPPAA